MSLFEHVPHPHVKRRQAAGPVKVADQASRGHLLARFNAAVGLRITVIVGTMWAAYAFFGLAVYGLPQAIQQGPSAIVLWTSSEFLQLCLLPIVIVGQNLQARAADARSEQTWHDASATLHECLELQRHLQAQDRELARLVAVHAMATDLHARHGGGAENTHD